MENGPLTNEQRNGFNWITTAFMGVFHLGAVAALFWFDWGAIAVAFVLYWVTIGMGIGMGYHRLHTHRGYKVPKFIEYVLAVFGTMTLQGGPNYWVALHRVHHAYSDRPGDPHSPREGTWWSHAGWIVTGKTLHNDTEILAKWAPDLAKDRFYVWLTKWHFVPLVASGVLLLAFGGWAYVYWGVFMRVVIGLHATWFVNSASHIWGGRRFETKDDSRNNWWVAVLTFGEGWHNNHHAHPTSARHGLAWYELDPTWWSIRALEVVGLAKSVKLAKVTQPVAAKPKEQVARPSGIAA